MIISKNEKTPKDVKRESQSIISLHTFLYHVVVRALYSVKYKINK